MNIEFFIQTISWILITGIIIYYAYMTYEPAPKGDKCE